MSDPARKRPPLILLVDDDSDNHVLAEEALGEAGFSGTVRSAFNGQELLDYLEDTRGSQAAPDLILLDLEMPVKTGHEALTSLKSDAAWKGLPVVILSGSTAPEDIRASYEAGASGFIAKPQTFDSLVQAMRSVLDYWFVTTEPVPSSGVRAAQPLKSCS